MHNMSQVGPWLPQIDNFEHTISQNTYWNKGNENRRNKWSKHTSSTGQSSRKCSHSEIGSFVTVIFWLRHYWWWIPITLHADGGTSVDGCLRESAEYSKVIRIVIRMNQRKLRVARISLILNVIMVCKGFVKAVLRVEAGCCRGLRVWKRGVHGDVKRLISRLDRRCGRWCVRSVVTFLHVFVTVGWWTERQVFRSDWRWRWPASRKGIKLIGSLAVL